MGKVAIRSLDDAKLAEMANSRPSTVDEAKAKVAALEKSIDLAKNAHYAQFGTRTMGRNAEEGVQLLKSQEHISSLQTELHWAKQDSVNRQNYADTQTVRHAAEAHSALPKGRMFQVSDRHGRIARHRAHDVEHLRQELTPGYEIIAEIFGFASDGTGGFAASLDSSVMTGLLEAHGDEVAAWLEANGFRRLKLEEA